MHILRFQRLVSYAVTLFVIINFHVTSSANAEQITGFGPDPSKSGYGIEENWPNGTASMRQLEILVRSTKTISVCDGSDCIERESDMQVSLVVVDNGPSTDVSATAGLYLAMYNSVEETGIAYAFHTIADIEKMYSAKRMKPGIYEVIYQEFWPKDACLQPKMRAVIDARDLSVKVRAAKGLQHLSDVVFNDPIDVTYERLDCPKG